MSNKNLVFDEVHNMLALPRHAGLCKLKHVASFFSQEFRDRWKGNYWKDSASAAFTFSPTASEDLQSGAFASASQGAIWVFGLVDRESGSWSRREAPFTVLRQSQMQTAHRWQKPWAELRQRFAAFLFNACFRSS